jgi:hypothetical protein
MYHPHSRGIFQCLRKKVEVDGFIRLGIPTTREASTTSDMGTNWTAARQRCVEGKHGFRLEVVFFVRAAMHKATGSLRSTSGQF